MDVVLVSGGSPIAGLPIGGARLVQLAAVSAAQDDLRTLIDDDGRPVDDAFRAQRKQRLLSVFREFDPTVLIVEMFPFGRRQMRFELLPLLDAACSNSPRPLVICSVRDILQTGRAAHRTEEAATWVERYFDAVLVHGDPAIAKLEDTFPLAKRIQGRTVYTGYLAPDLPEPPPPDGDGWGEILISSAGGAVGETLLRTAMAARRHSRLAGHTWRFLAGHALPSTAFESLRDAQTVDCIVERSRDDFRSLLRVVDVSVSQCGYNTAIDVLQSGARSVIVPYAAFGETEQTFRAERLASLALVDVVAEAGLSPKGLAAAIDNAATRTRVRNKVRLDGAAQSVALVRRLLEDR